MLTYDLSKISTHRLARQIGQDQKEYFKIDFEIRASFHSAHIEWRLWFENECFGSVQANYE